MAKGLMCPNISHPTWRKLVDALGEQTAWKTFISNGDELPSDEKVDEIIATYPKTSTVYTLKALNILSSERGQRWMRANKGIFNKNKEQYWTKFQQDLQIPKAQVQLIREIDSADPMEIMSEFAAKYGFSVEVKTAKTYNEPWQGNSFSETKEQYVERVGYPSDVYGPKGLGMIVPGGTNYSEQEISTPLITPSIKGHAQFATDKGIGWFRSDDAISKTEEKNREKEMLNSTQFEKGTGEDDWGIKVTTTSQDLANIKNQPTKTRRILEVQSDLFQKGRDKSDLTKDTNVPSDLFEELYIESQTQGWTKEQFEKEKVKLIEKYGLKDKVKSENQFLQLLNKDNNWVTFFIKSLIQATAKETTIGIDEADIDRKIAELDSSGELKIKCD